MDTLEDRITKGNYWDKAWSLVEGCSPVSKGCRKCWSMRQTRMRARQKNKKVLERYSGLLNEKHFNGKIREMWNDLERPLKSKKRHVWSIWNDLFHENVTRSFQTKAFEIMEEATSQIFLILTKRPLNLVSFLIGHEYLTITPLHNVLFGVSVEDQATVQRIHDIFKIRRYVPWIFISVEPFLSKIDISFFLKKVNPLFAQFTNKENIDWVICGGETGQESFMPGFPIVKDLLKQCQKTETPFYFKGWGHKAFGRKIEGVTYNQLPLPIEEILKSE